MSHLSGQGPSAAADSITDTSTVGGPTVKDSLDTLNAAKAPLASPVFTGNARAVTPAANDNDTSIATTAYVQTELADYAPLASPALTGVPTGPTAAANTNTTQLASTAYVQTELADYATTAALADYAPLASPALTGNPTAPTPATADNDTSIATTANVKANLAAYSAPIYITLSLVVGTAYYFSYRGPAATVSAIYYTNHSTVDPMNATVTPNIGGVAITDGAATLSTSTPGHTTTATPSAANVLATGNIIGFVVTGDNDSGSCSITIVLTT